MLRLILNQKLPSATNAGKMDVMQADRPETRVLHSLCAAGMLQASAEYLGYLVTVFVREMSKALAAVRLHIAGGSIQRFRVGKAIATPH